MAKGGCAAVKRVHAFCRLRETEREKEMQTLSRAERLTRVYSRENSSKMCHIDKYAHPRRRNVASFAVNGQDMFSDLNSVDARDWRNIDLVQAARYEVKF